MSVRVTPRVVIVAMLSFASAATAQEPAASAVPSRHVDPVNGMTLEQAIARALEQEPSLLAARSQIDIARGMRMQSSLRPNPAVSFEHRAEPQGLDTQTMVSLEWPLDLFRRDARVAVADRQVTAAEFAVADRQRFLVADVRTRYGQALATLRDLALLGELVAASGRQRDLLRARVNEGASAPLDRDLVEIEVRRLESDRLLQAGRVDVAFIELKRVLGMRAGEPLALRETLEDVVRRDSVGTAVSDPAAVVERRPDVRESATRVEIAGAKLERARSEGRFDVDLFASYSRMNSGFPQLGVSPEGGLTPIRSVFHYLAAGAMVTVPLRNRNQGEIVAAQAERREAALSHEATRLTVESERAAARARDEHAQQALRLYSSGVQSLARQNLAVVEQSFDLGRVTVFDVLAERRRYIDVARGYTEALRTAYDARTALSQAIGEGR